MNWQQGLQRMSFVWWGFIGLLFCAMMIGGLMPDASDRAFLLIGGLAGVVSCAIAHKVSCWIVAGFFAPRS